MLSPLRNRFGIPGVISVIALVFAMLGGAYAASNNSSGKATASAKAKKGPRGPKGATGPAGPQGPAGPAGPAGAKGDAGAAGAAGGVGPAGPTGPTGAKGATGATGATGFSGFTETLPKEKTETGTWGAEGLGAEFTPALVATISYTIPLAAPSANVVVLNKSETDNSTTTPVQGCEFEPADPTAVPVAPKDTLCVFTRREEEGSKVTGASGNAQVPGLEGSDSRVGAYIWGKPAELAPELGIGKFYLAGTWAVTAK